MSYEEISFSDYDYVIERIIETNNFDKFILGFKGYYYQLIEQLIDYADGNERKVISFTLQKNITQEQKVRRRD